MLHTDIGNFCTNDQIELPEAERKKLLQRITLFVALTVAAWTGWNANQVEVPVLYNPVIVHRQPVNSPQLAAAAHVNPRFQRLSAYVSDRFDLDEEEALEIVSAVFRNAEQVGLPPHLVLGIIAVESGFNSEAAYLGAKGLMQIIPTYHQPLMREINHDLFDPESNIYAGTRILAQFKQMSPTLQMALLRYNGSANDPNQTYSRKVLAEARKFEAAEQQTQLVERPTKTDT